MEPVNLHLENKTKVILVRRFFKVSSFLKYRVKKVNKWVTKFIKQSIRKVYENASLWEATTFGRKSWFVDLSQLCIVVNF